MKNNISSPRDYRQRQIEYNDAVLPFIHEKSRVLNLLPRKIEVYPDGRVVNEVIHTPETKEWIEFLDEYIAILRREILGV